MTNRRYSNVDLAFGLGTAAFSLVPIFGAILGPLAVYLGVSLFREGDRRAGGATAAAIGVVGTAASVWLIVSNFHEAETRSHLSRYKSDLRFLSTAIESYRADNGSLPAWTVDSRTSALSTDAHGTVPSFRTDMASLTTPVSYLLRYFQDTNADPPTASFAYMTTADGSSYIVWSAGPDGDYDLPWQDMVRGIVPMALYPFTYDPTNGTLSNGDMWLMPEK